MDMRPWSSVHRDGDGLPEVVFHPMIPGVPTRLVKTVRAGVEYEIRYERRPDLVVEQRDKELALFPLVLAARERGILAHACGFQLAGGQVVMAPGVSGTGKSTLARLVGDHGGGDMQVLNDDRIALTADGGPVHAWSTPWPGREGIARAGNGPLALIAFLRRASNMQVSNVNPRDGARRLLRMLALPLWDRQCLAQALEFTDLLVTSCQMIELAYPQSREAGIWIAETCRRIVM